MPHVGHILGSPKKKSAAQPRIIPRTFLDMQGISWGRLTADARCGAHFTCMKRDSVSLLQQEHDEIFLGHIQASPLVFAASAKNVEGSFCGSSPENFWAIPGVNY